MKKRIFSILLSAVLAFTSIQLMQVPAKAETTDSGIEAATTLDAMDVGSLNQGDEKWYKYTMPEDGHVNFTLTSADSGSEFWFYIYDNDQKELISNLDIKNSFSTGEIAFEPGTTVYLKVISSFLGDKEENNVYSLSADFTAATDWENELANDEKSGADTLADDTVLYGDIISYNDCDWYKYKLPSNGSVSFSVENTYMTPSASWYTEVCDSAGQTQDFISTGDSDYSPAKIHGSDGDYVYVGVTKDSDEALGSTYQISAAFTPDTQSSDDTDSIDDTGTIDDSENTSTVTKTKKETTVDKAFKKYKAFYKKRQKEDQIDKKISFIYLDNNTVPEMIISNGDANDESMPEIYTYYKGKIVSTGNLLDYIYGTCYASDIKYVKKKGVISMRSVPLNTVHVYLKLKKGKFSLLAVVSDDDSQNSHGTCFYKVGKGKQKKIKHSQFNKYEKKFNKKYAKGAKSIKMYDIFDEAENALSGKSTMTSGDATVLSEDGDYNNVIYNNDFSSPYASDKSKVTSAEVTINGDKLVYSGTLYKITDITPSDADPNEDRLLKSTALEGQLFTVTIPGQLSSQKEFEQLKENLKKYKPGKNGSNEIEIEISNGSVKSIVYDCRVTEDGREFGWYIKVDKDKSNTATLKY